MHYFPIRSLMHFTSCFGGAPHAPTHACLLARLPSPTHSLSLSPSLSPACVCVVRGVCVGCFRGNFLAWVVLSCVCTCMHACEWSVVVVV
jgi:hypothetical protein